ncbi:hypothetical protein DB347_21225 [Opitutaceae bacterium EW11]|nr:hypothetical protein DB347_21225 [Opitutaceae bacterium EW11]
MLEEFRQCWPEPGRRKRHYLAARLDGLFPFSASGAGSDPLFRAPQLPASRHQTGRLRHRSGLLWNRRRRFK